LPDPSACDSLGHSLDAAPTGHHNRRRPVIPIVAQD
jgi:hypothetical protein